MYWYWWAWFAIIVFLIFVPLTYGWGYRGWGPPYPRSYSRYRHRRADLTGSPPPPPPPAGDELERGHWVYVEDRPPEPVGAWGILGDLLWLAVIGAIIWAIVAYWH